MNFFSTDKNSGSKLEQGIRFVGALSALGGVLLLQFGQGIVDSALIFPLFLTLWAIGFFAGLFVAPKILFRAYRNHVEGKAND